VLERSEWLISPHLAQGARLEIGSLIETEELTPEVLELLAKFVKNLQRLERLPRPIPARSSTTAWNMTGRARS
jgi:hypothetical protein